MDVVADRLTIENALISSGLLIARASIIGVIPSVQLIPLLELLDQVDVDEVDAQRLILDSGLLQVVEQGVDELGDLLFRRGPPPL